MNTRTALQRDQKKTATAFSAATQRPIASENQPALSPAPGSPGGYSFDRMNVTAGAGRTRSTMGGGDGPVSEMEATEEQVSTPMEETSEPQVSYPDEEPLSTPMLSWVYNKRYSHDALWWFNGEHPLGFSITATLEAVGYTDPTTLTWRITRGADKVAFVGAPSGATVTLRSKAASRRADDVDIEVSEGGGPAARGFTGHMTVRAPHRLIQRSVNDSASLPAWASPPAGAVGWWTTIGYRVVDNVGGTIVGATVNENFPSAKTNDQPNNWVDPSSFATVPVWPNTNGTFVDNWFVWNGSPTPVAPTAANANQSVDSMAHEFYVGSTTSGRGVRVQTHTAHRYLGFARHENITTPAP